MHMFRYIPEHILGDDWKVPIYAIADYFPSTISKQYILESHLCEDKLKCDFAFHVKNDALRHFILDTGHKKFSKLMQEKTWINIQSFCQYLSDANLMTSEYIDFLWFEFDIDNKRTRRPVPVYFIHIKNLIHNDILINYNSIYSALDILNNKSLDKSIYKNINHCYENLFNNIKINYIGFMPTRSQDQLRVCFIDIQKEELFEYLAKLGQTGVCDDLQSKVTPIFKFIDNIRLHLDIGKKIIPKIGIELHINQPYNNNKKWFPLFNYLIENKLVNKSKCDALMNSNGMTTEKLIPELKGYKTYHYLYYIKLVYQPETELDFKAYYSFNNIPH